MQDIINHIKKSGVSPEGKTRATENFKQEKCICRFLFYRNHLLWGMDWREVFVGNGLGRSHTEAVQC